MNNLVKNFKDNDRKLFYQKPVAQTEVIVKNMGLSPSDRNWMYFLSFLIVVLFAAMITFYFTLYQKPTNKSFHTLGSGTIDGDLTLNGKFYYDDNVDAQPFFQSGSFIVSNNGSNPGTHTIALDKPYSSTYHVVVTLDLTVPTSGGITSNPPTYIYITDYTSNNFTVTFWSSGNGTSNKFGYTYLAYGT